MTTTQAIAAAVRLELERRSQYLDAIGPAGLASVQVTVKFEAITGKIRSTSWHEERLAVSKRIDHR